jgi:hypothetical protein
MCPYGRSLGNPSTGTQQIIASAQSGVTATGYKTANGVDEGKALVVDLPHGLKVGFDLNVEFELLNYVQAGAGAIAGTGMIVYRRDVDAEFSSPISFDLSGCVLCDPSTAKQVAVKVNGYDMDTGLWFYLNKAATGTPDMVAGDRWWVNTTYNDGMHWTSHDHNTLHQMEECSGRGTCERSTGQCACAAGYTGDACSRTSCPNDCSSHGVCQAVKRFAADVGLTYGAWDADAEFACKCDAGYRGPSCNQVECPSGADPMGATNDGATTPKKDCSGRGLCDYTTGICKCFTGFYGERCESLSNMV